jgi:hydrogenase/urease accessory protein HupE
MKVFTGSIIYLLCPLLLLAHPIPDIPVIGSFERNGSASITIEVDPRCFAEDPEEVPFLQKEAFDKLGSQEKKELTDKARTLMQKALRVRFGSEEWFFPEFRFDFLTKEHETIVLDGKVIVIRGIFERNLNAETASYQIKAMEGAPYDLVFTNVVDGKPLRRVNVLWPDEESFVLDLAPLIAESEAGSSGEGNPSSSKDPLPGQPEVGSVGTEEDSSVQNPVPEQPGGISSTFFSYLRQGFVHVVPLGVDHILFVIGLFLLSRKWKPLLYQVSVFTIAHTLTLALATLGLVSLPSDVVEPIIAASIAFVALENIFVAKYRPYRLAVVFVFGLIHGLGFAGALSEFNLDPGSLFAGLLGFNLGVEFGQLAVIGSVLIITLGIKDPATYRKIIVIPGSVLIAVIGAYWTIERIFF